MTAFSALHQYLRHRPRNTSTQQIQIYLSNLIRAMVGLIDSAEIVVDITTAKRDSVLLFYTLAARSTMKPRMFSISQIPSPSRIHMLFQFS